MKIKSKGKKLNKAWLRDHLNDPYVKLAQKEGYRARAAYKLKEIDEELRLLRPGQLVVDLGAAPGAWSQYLRRKFAARGTAGGALDGEIIALDILDFEPIDGVRFLQGDFREDLVVRQLEEALAGRKAEVVVSDMAPNLSGVASSDAARMADLVELAVEFAGRGWIAGSGAAARNRDHADFGPGDGADAIAARRGDEGATGRWPGADGAGFGLGRPAAGAAASDAEDLATQA